MGDREKIEGNFQEWSELMDLGFEMALAGMGRHGTAHDPLDGYKRRWARWQEDHLKAGISYLEVITGAAGNKHDSD
ncbi:MAG: hypothetical protein RDV48_20255 [Candidatus Eremiobacteraeota bacterium]|nr:hypothetical protein [Candidatus Eremiobacteraeota bacterium]